MADADEVNLSYTRLLGAPFYTRETVRRILAARAAALQARHRAYFEGRSQYTDAAHYRVKSSTSEHSYYIEAHDHARGGGFVYSVGAEPLVWLKCECEAARWEQPCRHGARVQLSLERDARERTRTAGRQPVAGRR